MVHTLAQVTKQQYVIREPTADQAAARNNKLQGRILTPSLLFFLGISLCAKKNKEQFQYQHYCFNRVFAVITKDTEMNIRCSAVCLSVLPTSILGIINTFQIYSRLYLRQCHFKVRDTTPQRRRHCISDGKNPRVHSCQYRLFFSPTNNRFPPVPIHKLQVLLRCLAGRVQLLNVKPSEAYRFLSS